MPREIETGWREGDDVEVRGGLREGDRVLVGATFLIDSESRLRSPAAAATSVGASVSGAQDAAERMPRDPSCGMPVNAKAAAAAGNTLVAGGATLYFCSSKCKEQFAAAHASATLHPGNHE
jgi:YHS domain-containing protein